MKISFLVTAHKETTDLDFLLNQLTTYKETDPECEILVLHDDTGVSSDTMKVIQKYTDSIRYVTHKLNNQFGPHKQFGNEQCTGDYIFQIDADEYFNDTLLYNLKALLEANENVDLFMIPRINRIKGLTEHHVKKWGWRLSAMKQLIETKNNMSKEEYLILKSANLIVEESEGTVTHHSLLINWPDFQFRLYRNHPDIKWERDLHELVTGAGVMTTMPADVHDWALFHDKTIEKQEEQNLFYNTNFSRELNVRKA